ncbi:MAG: hypothetical protein FLDDKLPJ_03738 [Phycisphaerae bacterium]|nr:hypothetical protein [Phycisphaerae bacterium]
MSEQIIVNVLTTAGEYGRGVEMPYGEALRLAEEKACAYTCDEFLHELRSLQAPLRDRRGRDVTTLPILDMPPMPRALLWFIQSHVGEMRSLDAISRFFRVSITGKHHRHADNRIQQCKQRLGGYLPEGLITKMMPRSHQRLICIPRGGWSFCWIRRPDQGSDLLLGVTADPNCRPADDSCAATSR